MSKYNLPNLQKFCKENCINLIHDFDNIKLTQKSRITGICLSENCNEQFDKSFENLFKRNGYCNKCTTINKIIKQKQTFLKNYGVENPNKIKDIRDKIKITNLEKYGTEYSIQNVEVKNKIKKTMLKKYGVENPLQNKDIRDKIKITNLKKYGTEYSSQNEEIKKKLERLI